MVVSCIYQINIRHREPNSKQARSNNRLVLSKLDAYLKTGGRPLIIFVVKTSTDILVDCCDTLRLAGESPSGAYVALDTSKISLLASVEHVRAHFAAVALASRLPDGPIRFHQPRVRSGRREEPAGFIHKSAFNESDGLSQLYDRRLAYDGSDFGGGEKADIHADRRCIESAVRLHEHGWPHRIVEHRR
jgi:hypothetical protein